MMELREQIARAICGNWVVGDDRPWQQWAEEADAVIEVLRQQKPVAWMCSSEALLRMGCQKFSTTCSGDWNIPVYAGHQGAQAAVPDGWLRAIDEEMVGAHIGVTDASDDYAAAKEKLNKLICWHVAVATDPAVNGGWQLVPVEPTPEMLDVSCYSQRAQRLYRAMLAAAPKLD